MTKDRFSQMNDILDECVADVKKRMDTITLSRKRVDKGGPTNFSPAQIGAIAAEAIRQRQALIDKAAEAAVVGQIVSG